MPSVRRGRLSGAEVVKTHRVGRASRPGACRKIDGRFFNGRHLRRERLNASSQSRHTGRQRHVVRARLGIHQSQHLGFFHVAVSRGSAKIPFIHRVFIGRCGAAEREEVVVKTVWIRRCKVRFEQELNLHLGRGHIGTREVGSGGQADLVDARIGEGVGGIGVGACAGRNASLSIPEVPIECVGVRRQVVEVECESSAKLVLVFHRGLGLRGRGPRERGIRGATVVVDTDGDVPRVGVPKGNASWAGEVRQIGGSRSEIPKHRGVPVDVAFHGKVKHLHVVLAGESIHHNGRLQRLPDLVQRLRRICARPSGIHHERHPVIPGLRPCVRGLKFCAHVRGDVRHPKIPFVARSVHRVVVEGDGLANAQLRRYLLRNHRLNVGVTQGHVELKIPHRGAEQHAVAKFRHTDGDGVLTGCRWKASDDARDRVNAHGRIRGDGIGSTEPADVFHLGVRWRCGWIGHGAVDSVAAARAAAVKRGTK